MLKKLISSQLDNFRKGEAVKEESDIRAKRGAYLLVDSFELTANEEKNWRIIADVNKSITDLVALEETIADKSIDALIDEDIQAGTKELLQLVGSTDGLQLTNDRRGNHRHFANSMFNIMRGGIFDDNYTIEKQDFSPHSKSQQKGVPKQGAATQ